MANDGQPKGKPPAANGEAAPTKRINLVGVDLQGTSMARRNLEYADFRAAELQGVDFSESNLRYADFRGAKVQGANFQGASLYGAKMQGVEAFGANFRHCDLRQANLDGAYLDKSMMPWSDRLPSPSEIGDGVGEQVKEKAWQPKIEESRKGKQPANTGKDQNEQAPGRNQANGPHDNGRGRGR